MNPNTPVIVGVAQLINRVDGLDDYIEPIELMLHASYQAQLDTGVRLLDKLQSVRVIKGIWTYENPAAYLAEQFGATGAQTVGTLIGGNYNQVMVNATAEAILAGQLDLALITGAETGNSMAKARKSGLELEMKALPGAFDELLGGTQHPEHHDYEIAKGIRQAIAVYPLYENALRFSRGESIPEHLKRVSELWERFSIVAQNNPNAWLRRPFTAEEIRSASKTNRLVSFPYPKLMNSNNAVDMAAALILCSVKKARSLGIPESRWVYPLAGVEGRDHFSASVRDNFHTSPGIRLVGQRLFELTGVEPGDVDLVDLYSCFPAAVQIAAAELRLSEDRDLTVTGGLTFGGGPLNNYVMHSIARTVDLIRQTPEKKGLVTANGGNLYKHAYGMYSGEPPEQNFKRDNVQERIDALPSRTCLPEFSGRVTIESYTVMYGAEGPVIAHLACINENGERIWANTDDADIMKSMSIEEFCGRAATLNRDKITFQ